MNIYLDIDGVILTKDKKPSIGITEFLKKATSNHSVYWLTTHCKGDTQNAVQHLKRFLPMDTHQDLEKIQPTDWDVLKTDAIDFSKDFLWFDDYLMEVEKRVLEKNNCSEKVLLVHLKDQPDSLIKYLEIL